MKRRKLIQTLVAGSAAVLAGGRAEAAPRKPRNAVAGGGRQQFLLFDHQATFKDNWSRRSPDWIEEPADGFLMLFRGKEFAERRSREIPDDWTTPVNYAQGTLQVRIEVLEKPNDTITSGLILRLITEKHGGNHSIWFCSETCKFNRTGIFHFSEPVAAGKRHYGPHFRFDRPLYEAQLIVTDDARGIVHKGWERGWKGEPDLTAYLPLKARFSAIVVAPGSTFAPPAWW
jgi:hypothetical protein